jgi:riboflavin synthase
MFSGIIEEVGRVKKISTHKGFLVFEISCPKISKDIKEGDSISVNGVCLTAEKVSGDIFQASLSVQTQKETNLGSIKTGDKLNLETSLKMGDKIGGHFLSGHIDFVAKIKTFYKEGGSITLSFALPHIFEKYVVNRGSIGVDGISLTVSEIKNREVKIFLIPFTLNKTTLTMKKTGDKINIETDIMAKYAEKNAGNLLPKNKISFDTKFI